jgi:hypothetical protein
MSVAVLLSRGLRAVSVPSAAVSEPRIADAT